MNTDRVMQTPAAGPQAITLSEAEIVEITGYQRPVFQLEALKEMGIPARRRPDNSVMVLRVYATTRPAAEKPLEKPEPQLRLIRK